MYSFLGVTLLVGLFTISFLLRRKGESKKDIVTIPNANPVVNKTWPFL